MNKLTIVTILGVVSFAVGCNNAEMMRLTAQVTQLEAENESLDKTAQGLADQLNEAEKKLEDAESRLAEFDQLKSVMGGAVQELLPQLLKNFAESREAAESLGVDLDNPTLSGILQGLGVGDTSQPNGDSDQEDAEEK